MATKKRAARPKAPVDGTKYYHYRQHYIRTGSMRSFDLMTRHYEAAGLMDLPPLPESTGRRRKPVESLLLSGRCYSDHNEDIFTKGSCDYCGGTKPVFFNTTLALVSSNLRPAW